MNILFYIGFPIAVLGAGIAIYSQFLPTKVAERPTWIGFGILVVGCLVIAA